MSDVEPGQKLYAVKWGAMTTWTVEKVTAKQIKAMGPHYVATLPRSAAHPFGVSGRTALWPTAWQAATERIALLTREIADRQREVDALTASYLVDAS